MPYLSALKVCSRQGAIQIHVYLYLYYCCKWLIILNLTIDVVIIIIIIIRHLQCADYKEVRAVAVLYRICVKMV